MPKRYNIRWRDKDLQELRRVVKNFNQKISYHEKNNPQKADFLPSRITTKELKNKIETRQDFQRELASLERFGKRGNTELITNEKGVTISKYELNELKNKVRITNIKRTYERKKLNIDTTKGNMGQIQAQNLKPKKFNFMKKTEKEIEKLKESLENEVQANFKERIMEKYKENYIKAIENYLGEDGEELKKFIQEMTPQEVYQNSIENPILSIGFTSEPLPTETIASSALEEWKSV